MKRVGSTYADVVRTYLRWAPALLVLAAIVFVPIGLIHSFTISVDVNSVSSAGLLKLLGSALALSALVITGLLGEVFYAGAVAIFLTHPGEDRPPTLRELFGMIAYRRLIAVDLIYGALVTVGLLLLAVPGALAFVYFALAAPVVEIEGRGVRAAFARSMQLIRGSFWIVVAVLVPLELVGDGLTRLAASIAGNVLGDSLLSNWLADSLANIAFTPFYAVAAVLLTVQLIHRNDGDGPAIHSEPVHG